MTGLEAPRAIRVLVFRPFDQSSSMMMPAISTESSTFSAPEPGAAAPILLPNRVRRHVRQGTRPRLSRVNPGGVNVGDGRSIQITLIGDVTGVVTFVQGWAWNANGARPSAGLPALLPTWRSQSESGERGDNSSRRTPPDPEAHSGQEQNPLGRRALIPSSTAGPLVRAYRASN